MTTHQRLIPEREAEIKAKADHPYTQGGSIMRELLCEIDALRAERDEARLMCDIASEKGIEVCIERNQLRNQLADKEKEIARLREINTQQATVIREHKWDSLIEKLAESEAREVVLRGAAEDARNMIAKCFPTNECSCRTDGSTCWHHQVQRKLREALSSTSPPPLLAVLKEVEEELEFICNGCMVPPDGGSPNHPEDCVAAAKEALASLRQVLGGGG